MNWIPICSVLQSHTSYFTTQRVYYQKATWIQWRILNSIDLPHCPNSIPAWGMSSLDLRIILCLLSCMEGFPITLRVAFILRSWLTILAWQGELLRRWYVDCVCVWNPMRESIEFWSVLVVLCLGGRIDRYCSCLQVRLVLLSDSSS